MGLEVEVLEDQPSYFLTGKAYFNSLQKECNYANVIYKLRFKHIIIKKSDECQRALYLSPVALEEFNCNSNLVKLLTYL